MAAPSRLIVHSILGFGLLASGAAAFAARGEDPALSAAPAASAQRVAQLEPPSGITAFGDGEARAEPDIAVISVGATHIAPTAQEATDEVSRRVGAVVGAARGHGLQDRDIQTSGISLQPITRPRPGPDQLPPSIEGYRATNSVSLTVRDISRASAVLDSVTASGANVVSGLRFALSNAPELRTRALEQRGAQRDPERPGDGRRG